MIPDKADSGKSIWLNREEILSSRSPDPHSAPVHLDIRPGAKPTGPSHSDWLRSFGCEYSIQNCWGEEAHRKRNGEDRNEEEVQVECSGVPALLSQSIELINEHFDVKSHALITKLLARQVEAILPAIHPIKEINKNYIYLNGLLGAYGGDPDIGVSRVLSTLNEPTYELIGANKGMKYLHMARRIIDSISLAAGKGLGMRSSSLSASLYALSLSTCEVPELQGMVRSLKPEVDNFQDYLEERQGIIAAYRERVEARISCIGNGGKRPCLWDKDEALRHDHPGGKW